MNTVHKMCCSVCLVVLLVVSALAAPVTKTDTKTESLPKTSVKAESVAAAEKELRQLTHEGGDSVPLPKSSEELLKLEESEKESAPLETSQEVPSDAILPAKRLPQIPKNVVPRLQTAINEEDAYDGEALPPYTDDAEVFRNIAQPNVDLTPEAVAEYLIVTGDFNGFEQAITELINAQVLSPQEVQEYKEAVSLAYESMLQQVVDAETEYVQEAARPIETEYYNTLPQRDVPYVLPADYAQEPEMIMDPGFQTDLRRAQYQRAMEREQQAALDELLDGVLNEYYMSLPEEQDEPLPAYNNIDQESSNTNPEDLDKMMSWMQALLKEEPTSDGLQTQSEAQEETPEMAASEDNKEDVAKELEDLQNESNDDAKAKSVPPENESASDAISYDKNARIVAETASA